jgi:glycogen operon protein
VFRRRRWFQGQLIRGSGGHDIGWFSPDGTEMSEEDWNTGFVKSLGVFLNGEGIAAPSPRGERIIDDSFYIVFNSHHEPMTFKLPARAWGRTWVKIIDTAEPQPQEEARKYRAERSLQVQSRSLVVLRREN